jgi:hypothetical protein
MAWRMLPARSAAPWRARTGSIGFTRRAGCTRHTHESVQRMLEEFPGAIPGMSAGHDSGASSAEGRPPRAVTALVFGREESGLQVRRPAE